MRIFLVLSLVCCLWGHGEALSVSSVAATAQRGESEVLLQERRPPWPRDIDDWLFVAYVGAVLLTVSTLRSRRALLVATTFALLFVGAVFTYQNQVGVDRESGVLWR